MTGGAVQIPSFTMELRDPFLDLLIVLVSEPHGPATADHAAEVTREWWDEHGAGPSCDELLTAMFAPDDWCSVIDDPHQTLMDREAQTVLLRAWLLQYWARIGAISYVAGHDSVVRPGHRRHASCS